MLVLGGAAYSVEAWESFAVAEVGAAAALAGLLVVASSINIARIIELPAVVNRLGATLTLFTGILVVASLLLVPGVDHRISGSVMAAVGLAVALIVYVQRGFQHLESRYRRYARNAAATGMLAALFIVVGGIGYATTSIGGLYWLVPGVLIGFGVGLVNAWVALVEILR